MDCSGRGWLEDSAPWCGASCLPGLGPSLDGAPCDRGLGALSVWSAPKGGFFLALGLSVCACVCLFVSISLWVFMGVGGLVCFIIVVFSLCEALCVAFKV